MNQNIAYTIVIFPDFIASSFPLAVTSLKKAKIAIAIKNTEASVLMRLING